MKVLSTLVAVLFWMGGNPATTTNAWLYTLPEGGCENLKTCHSCVVEYARDFGVARRPCTWCPAKQQCEMMNQWTGTCSTGDTVREICRITPSKMSRCIYMTYSYWICFGVTPTTTTTPDQCNANFVNDFCSPQTVERQVQLCNGNHIVLESVMTGFGRQDAVVVTKNGYGLEVNMKYFWFNAGYGEDRRKLETDHRVTTTWLCNANMNPSESVVLKYRLHEEEEETTGDDDNSGWQEEETDDNDDSSGGTRAFSVVALPILLAFLFICILHWSDQTLFWIFCSLIDCKKAQEAIAFLYH